MKHLLCTILLLLTAVLRAQTLELDKPAYYPGETITVTWSGGPANRTDWVGIYRPTQVPGSGPFSTLWGYANGTHNVPAAGSADATFSFTGSNLAVGSWVARFFENDGYLEVAAPVFFSVVEPPEADIGYLVASSYFIGGSPIELSWSILDNGVAITSVTLDDGSGPVDVSADTILEVNPAVTTTYTLDINGGEATRKITLWKAVAGTPDFSTDKTSYRQGETVTVTWNNAISDAKDWTGVYRVGDTPGPQPSTKWFYTEPASGTQAFTGLTEGDYYVCRFETDGYATEFGPVRFTVLPALPQVKAFGFSGTSITLTWSSSGNVPAYTVEESDDLGEWHEMDNAIDIPSQGFETSVTLDIPAAHGASHYYRVVEAE